MICTTVSQSLPYNYQSHRKTKTAIVISNEVLNCGFGTVADEIVAQLALETTPIIVAPEDAGYINAIFQTRVLNLVGRINDAYVAAEVLKTITLTNSDLNNGELPCIDKIIEQINTPVPEY